MPAWCTLRVRMVNLSRATTLSKFFSSISFMYISYSSWRWGGTRRLWSAKPSFTLIFHNHICIIIKIYIYSFIHSHLQKELFLFLLEHFFIMHHLENFTATVWLDSSLAEISVPFLIPANDSPSINCRCCWMISWQRCLCCSKRCTTTFFCRITLSLSSALDCISAFSISSSWTLQRRQSTSLCSSELTRRGRSSSRRRAFSLSSARRCSNPA